METYPVEDNDGLQLGFEIDLVYIGPRKIEQLLSTVDGVTNIQRRKLFAPDKEIHVEFDYLGEKFVVWEPYGDSSRYWIYPKEKQPVKKIDISELEAVFMRYKPPIIVKILGDLLSLNFKKLLRLDRGKTGQS